MLDLPTITPMPDSITLRDYFATAVLQGWMANNAFPNDPPSKIAMEAYAMADQMLRARVKQ